jgi:hypothetical protein
MAATGFTPIQLYRTSTASAVPVNTNLADGELAINLTDERLYFKNAAGVVKLLASNAGALGTVSSVAGTGTVNGITLTGTVTSSGNLTLGGTLSGVSLATQVTGTLPVANGGTGATSLTANNVILGNGTSAPLFVAPGTDGNILTASGGTWVSAAAAPSQIYPGAGIAVSTGTAWATSKTSPTGTIVGTTDAQTLTNKRIDPRVSTTASTASLTPDIASFDQYNVTALAATMAINAPTGTPVNGTRLLFRILDNGTARSLTWNATYVVIGTILPTTTVINKTIYVGCIYNSDSTRWDVVSVLIQN